VSVVIPTHNRAATLRKCLDALVTATDFPPDGEILVMDDGSRDGTEAIVRAAAAAAPMRIAYERQPASGPAAARNRGVGRARGRVLLFLGDDIIASPGLIGEHLRAHATWPDPSVGILGYVTWAPGIGVTPYMRWLEASGNQFDYGALTGRDEADPALHLYTANLSLKREFLASTGELFDERFRHALLEDIDLGRRLAARGLRLKYYRNAVGHHDHAIELRRYVRRIERSSEYWVLLENKAASRRQTGDAADATPPTRAKRDYGAYAWYLARVAGEVLRTWPSWWAARYLERRRISQDVFVRAHRHWAHRGLLRMEAKRAVALLRRGA
jgi:glycosyltransferase involved in cell wall biosynthesis